MQFIINNIPRYTHVDREGVGRGPHRMHFMLVFFVFLACVTQILGNSNAWIDTTYSMHHKKVTERHMSVGVTLVCK